MKAAIISVALALPVVLFWQDIQGVVSPGAKASAIQLGDNDKKDKKGKKDKDEEKEEKGPSDVVIINKWDTPPELLEISGIAWLSNDRFACVQDELGSIFIYNTSTQKIEKQIPFSGAGDYEGVTLAGNTAYVLRADGKIYEVENINAAKPAVKEYTTHLTVKQDVEGLTYDKNNNRLLAAIKGDDPSGQSYKGIYAFDLKTKKMAQEPVYKIDLDHQVFAGTKGKKKNKILEPSEIAVHPTSGEIYISDADGKLLVMDNNGSIKNLYKMTDDAFTQAEGLSFSPDGKLYISNEGKKDAGNILEVQLKNQ